MAMNHNKPVVLPNGSTVCRRTKSCFMMLFCILTTTHSLHESPFRFPKKFQKLASLKTNVCERQKWLVGENTTVKNVLSGLNLTVALTDYPRHTGEGAYFSLSEDGTIDDSRYPGLFVILLDELALRAGFSWRNSFVAISALEESDGSKTWTDLLEWSSSHFDIVADFWFHNEDRRGLGIAFPKAFNDGSIIFAESKQSSRISFWGFLRPFHWGLWLIIAATIVTTSVAYWLMNRLDQNSEERDLKLSEALFFGAIMFTGHFFFEPRTLAAMLLSVSFTFWAFALTMTYTANMASFLLSRTSKANDQLLSIDDAITLGTPLCVRKNTAMDQQLSRYRGLNSEVLGGRAFSGSSFADVWFQWRLRSRHCTNMVL